MCTPMAGASLDARLAIWANAIVNPLAVVLVAMLADITASAADSAEANIKAICVLSKPVSFSALALAVLLLAHSHRISLPVSGAGVVPITAQTLVLCINALLFDPTVSLSACGIYIMIGMISACLQSHAVVMQLAPFGPRISTASGGYVFGFFAATALLAAAPRSCSWPFCDGVGKHSPFLLLAWYFAACALAQMLVLACGAAWLAARQRVGLSISVLPYVKGLVLKSLLAAVLVALLQAAGVGSDSVHSDRNGSIRFLTSLAELC